MKVLAMCQGGHVRSGGLKYILTYKYGHEVLACGWQSNSWQTREMLCDWADAIVIMQGEFIQYVPPKYAKTNIKPIICYDVGPDNYGNPFHPRLQNSLDSMIQKHGFFVKKK